MLCTAEKEKDELICGIFLWTHTHGHTSVDRPGKAYVYQQSSDTVQHLGDLPRTMAKRERERDREREREREIKESVWSE